MLSFQQIIEIIKINLKRFSALLIEDNMTIDHAANGKLGIKLACENIYDAVILDLNLPDVDGIEVCQLIKQNCSRQVPIIMLTARDSIYTKIKPYNWIR